MPKKRTEAKTIESIQGAMWFPSVDHFKLACNISLELWPRAYDLRRVDWFQHEVRRGSQLTKISRAAYGGPLPDFNDLHPADLYPRELIRLALLPQDKREKVLRSVVAVVRHAVRTGRIPRTPGKTKGRSRLSMGDDTAVRLLNHVASLMQQGFGLRKMKNALNRSIDEVRRLRGEVLKLGPPDLPLGHLTISMKGLREEILGREKRSRSKA